MNKDITLEDLGYIYKNYAGYVTYQKKLKDGNKWFINYDSLKKQFANIN